MEAFHVNKQFKADPVLAPQWPKDDDNDQLHLERDVDGVELDLGLLHLDVEIYLVVSLRHRLKTKSFQSFLFEKRATKSHSYYAFF
jgi:hypothetical protein